MPVWAADRDLLWRQIRTVSISAKIENLQIHKTIPHISHTHSQESWITSSLKCLACNFCLAGLVTEAQCCHSGAVELGSNGSLTEIEEGDERDAILSR